VTKIDQAYTRREVFHASDAQ